MVGCIHFALTEKVVTNTKVLVMELFTGIIFIHWSLTSVSMDSDPVHESM